jgi:hypothetical protein
VPAPHHGAFPWKVLLSHNAMCTTLNWSLCLTIPAVAHGHLATPDVCSDVCLPPTTCIMQSITDEVLKSFGRTRLTQSVDGFLTPQGGSQVGKEGKQGARLQWHVSHTYPVDLVGVRFGEQARMAYHCGRAPACSCRKCGMLAQPGGKHELVCLLTCLLMTGRRSSSRRRSAWVGVKGAICAHSW